jgi:hypothetical protein
MLQLVNEKISNYETFINDITEMVRDMMGEEYSVRIYKVTKNNSLELDSLVMMKEGTNFAPNIYLLPYYEAYSKGSSVKELADQLCKVYRNHTVQTIDEDFSFTYEAVKPYIIYRLVSYNRNKKLLDKIPHIKYLDMAITFHCLVREDNDGIGSIRITNEHMKQWETSVQEIYNLSIDNTKNLFPPVIRSMDEVILGMLKEEYMTGKEDELSDQILNQIIDSKSNSQGHKMFILSNQKGINGASCLLYDNTLKSFSNQINSDFYILPSSIHEVILVPFNKTFSKEALEEMVKEVNMTQVACDEILSDRVYFYSRKENKIVM